MAANVAVAQDPRGESQAGQGQVHRTDRRHRRHDHGDRPRRGTILVPALWKLEPCVRWSFLVAIIVATAAPVRSHEWYTGLRSPSGMLCKARLSPWSLSRQPRRGAGRDPGERSVGIRSSTRRCCPSPPPMATTTPAGAMRWENPTFVASCFPAWHPSLCAGFCLNSPYRSFPLARSGPFRRSLSCTIGAERRTPLSCRSRRAVVAKRSRSLRTPCSLCVRCEGCYDYVVRPEQRQWPGRQRHGAPRSGVCRRAAGRGHFVA
jgi:hypothetical protein